MVELLAHHRKRADEQTHGQAAPQPQRRVPPDEFTSNIRGLVGTLKQAGIRYMFLVEPIARPFTGYVDYVDIVRNFSAQYGIPVCDGFDLFNCERVLTGPSEMDPQFRSSSDLPIPLQKMNPDFQHLFGADPLHPNDDGFTLIAACIYEKLNGFYDEILGNSGTFAGDSRIGPRGE